MYAIDENTLGVDIRNLKLSDDQNNLNFTGVITKPETATAYYQIPPDFRDFITQLHAEYGVVGFEYDLETDTPEIGILIRSKE